MERIAAVVFSALALLSGSVAQEAQDVAKPLQYEVSVVLKLIHVYVVDAKGKPVEGLTRDDFVVTDNGRPVSVTAFERHLLASPPRPEEKSGPVPVIPAASPPPPAAAGRKFFLFFDLAFNNARGLTKAKTAALHFLDAEARPEDEIGVLSYSMFKGVSVREFLTADHGKVRKVLEKIDQRGIAGRASEIEDWYWRLVQEPLPGGQGEAGGLSGAQSQQYMKEAEAQRQESKRIAQVYILRLTDLAKALRYVPGQKHFILFSSGVPASLIYGSQAGNPNSMSGRAAFDPGDRTIRTQNEEMYKEFAASGCTFYAFDTRESAMVIDLFAYDRETFEIGSRGLGNTQGVFQDSTSTFRDDKTTGLNSLKRLTDITGGKYFSNINRYQKNLDQVQDLTGTYYVLGYSIGQPWDGQFHEVKVECRRKGCEVRAQTGYFNPKPFKELTPLERELQLFDLALNGRSDLYLPKIVPLAPLSYDAGEGMVLRTVSRIPRGALEGTVGKNVEFVSLLFDEQDNVVSLQRRTADFTQCGRDGLVFSSGLAAKPGAYKCRLVVRDLDTGKCAVGSTRAFVPGPSMGFVLYSPLLVTEGGPLAILDETVKRAGETPAWREIYAHDAAKDRPVIGDEAVDARRIAMIVPYRVPEPDRAQVSFSAHLVDSATGKSRAAVSEPLSRLRRGDVEILVLEIALEAVPPGRYTLFINGSDKTSGGLATAHVPLTVAPREPARVP